jgi:aerobic-type carbon monoxide dehydrogenase small subunit (CoxS/CutS family)
MKISFTLNNEKTTIDVDHDRRVIDVLREDLGLTGAKEGCGAGECGSCTIIVHGETRLSCLMLAPQLEGAVVETVEGLTPEAALTPEEGQHPLQTAFVKQGAVQCGFCTPGMLMTAVDLIRQNPNPSRAQIRQGISGNLCRCTGYQKIVDAIETAVRMKR